MIEMLIVFLPKPFFRHTNSESFNSKKITGQRPHRQRRARIIFQAYLRRRHREYVCDLLFNFH